MLRSWPLILASVVVLTACAAPVPYSTETAWPGSGTGKVEARTESESGPQVVDRDGNQATLPLRFLGINRDVPLGGRIPRHFHYQVRALDGTMHLIQSEGEFAVGSCVAFSGYADGPSRTHWSRGRVQVKGVSCDG
jgi:hypothetical protein